MQISRGDIWQVNLNPTKGHEQAGIRPCVVVSVDPFNNGPGKLVFVLPMTTTDRNIPFHIKIQPPESEKISVIRCDSIRSISTDRMIRRLGCVSQKTMAEIEDRLKILLGIY